MELPLPEGILKVNLGVPIVVVCSKADLIQHGDKKNYLEQNLDYIQKHIRDYCLQYGASVIFTSAIANLNLNVFYQYCVHRLYNFDFLFKPEIIERECLFLPAGFDSPNLIDQLSKAANILSVDQNGNQILFEDIIKRPA